MHKGERPGQNITLRLDQRTLRRAKVLAAKAGSSISALVARQIELMVEEDETYERAHREALDLLGRGFRLGATPIDRESLHER